MVVDAVGLRSGSVRFAVAHTGVLAVVATGWKRPRGWGRCVFLCIVMYYFDSSSSRTSQAARRNDLNSAKPENRPDSFVCVCAVDHDHDGQCAGLPSRFRSPRAAHHSEKRRNPICPSSTSYRSSC